MQEIIVYSRKIFIVMTNFQWLSAKYFRSELLKHAHTHTNIHKLPNLLTQDFSNSFSAFATVAPGRSIGQEAKTGTSKDRRPQRPRESCDWMDEL